MRTVGSILSNPRYTGRQGSGRAADPLHHTNETTTTSTSTTTTTVAALRMS